MKTIFVSSTFNDMQYERDAIQEIALPIINLNAKKYGESVSFCDLRWGVNTTDLESEAGSRKVLEVCLDEIDRSKPYMVVILGERYGWIPDRQLLREVAEKKNMDLIDLEMSVTALEIEYGALNGAGNAENTLFYFREFECEIPVEYSSEDEARKKKLIELKARIEKLSGGKVKYYNVSWDEGKLKGIEDFASMLAADVSMLLEPEWISRSALPDFERDRLIHEEFIEDNRKLFSIREEILNELIADIEQKKKLVHIDGACGSGKSVLLASLATRLKNDYDVLFYACGISAMSTAPSDISKGIVSYIENLLQKPHCDLDSEQDKNKIVSYTKELYREYDLSGRRLLLILDGLERLIATEVRDTLAFLPSPYSLSNCSFVICSVGLNIAEKGTTGSEYFMNEWSATKVIRLSVDPSDEEKKRIIQDILRANNKELDRSVIEYIVKFKKINSLYEINLIVHYLLTMNKEDFEQIRRYGNDMEAINRYQIELIEMLPMGEEELSCVLLQKFTSSMNTQFIDEALRYIAVSRFGLLETDLKFLVEGYNTLDFIRFVAFFDNFFIRRFDGRFDFSHQCIKRGILKTINNRSVYSRQIIRALSRRDDEVKLQEIPHQFIFADSKDEFVDYVIEWREYAFLPKIEILVQASDRAWYYAARALYEHCEEEGESWVVDLLNADSVNPTFIYFLNSKFCRYLDDHRVGKMIDMKIKIYSAIFMHTSETYEKENNDETERRHNLVGTLSRLAEASLERGTKFDIQCGIEYFKKYIKLIELLTEWNDPVYRIVDLPSTYSYVTLFTYKLDDPVAMEFTLSLFEKKFILESSEGYKTACVNECIVPSVPSLYDITRIACKIGTELSIQRVISLQHEEIKQNEKNLDKHTYIGQIYRYQNLISLCQRLDVNRYEKEIVGCCHKIFELVDSHVEIDSNIEELVEKYFDIYIETIEKLLTINLTSSINLGIEYSQKITSVLLAKKSVLGNLNEEIERISWVSGKLYSTANNPEEAISCFKLVAQIREICFLEKEHSNSFDVALVYKKLAEEYNKIQSEESSEKTVECYEKYLYYLVFEFDQKPTCRNFESVVRARDLLVDAKLTGKSKYSLQDAIKYRYETATMIEDKMRSSVEMHNLIYSLRDEWKSIERYWLDDINCVLIDTRIDVLNRYAGVLLKIIENAEQNNNLRVRQLHIEELKKCYINISGFLVECKDFYGAQKYLKLANNLETKK